MINLSLMLVNSTSKMEEDYIGEGAPKAIISGKPGAPAGMVKSDHADPTAIPRWNLSFNALVSVITGSIPVVAVSHGNGVYVEIDDIMISINRETLQSSQSLSQVETIVAALALALGSNNPGFDEIKSFYKIVTDQIKTKGKSDWQNALAFCHSFYHSMKTIVNTDGHFFGFDEGETLTEEMVKQLSSFSTEVNIVDFNKISPETIDFKHFDIKSEEKAEESSTPKGNIIERCKNGEFIIPFEWNEDQKAMIPPMDFLDLFVPSEDFEDALIEMKGYADRILRNIDLGKTGADAIGNNGKGFTFIGKPGTGKSTTTQAICAAMQMPYYMCTTTSGMEEDAFQGKVKLDHSDGNTGAAFKFCETQFLKAFEYGGLAVVEEFNLVPPEVIMGAIGQAIEKPFVLEKDGYIPIKRHPMCFIAFTCNVHMQGSKEPSGALVSRASNVYDIKDPKEEDFIRILSMQTEGVSDKVIKSVFRAYKTTLNILAETMPDVAKNITLRQCLSALDQVSFGIPIKRAIKNSILNSLKVFISDEEVLSDINEAVMTTIN